MMSISLDLGNIFDFILDHSTDESLEEQDRKGDTALWRAVRGKRKYMVSKLLARGAEWELNGDAGNAITKAFINFNMFDQLRQVIEAGADPHTVDKAGSNLLHIAASTDKADVVGYLVDLGVDVNAVDHSRLRPADYSTR